MSEFTDEMLEQILGNQVELGNALNELLYPHEEEVRSTRIPRDVFINMGSRVWNLLDKIKAARS